VYNLKFGTLKTRSYNTRTYYIMIITRIRRISSDTPHHFRYVIYTYICMINNFFCFVETRFHGNINMLWRKLNGIVPIYLFNNAVRINALIQRVYITRRVLIRVLTLYRVPDDVHEKRLLWTVDIIYVPKTLFTSVISVWLTDIAKSQFFECNVSVEYLLPISEHVSFTSFSKS